LNAGKAVSLPLNEAPWRKPRGTTETIQLSSRPALTDLPPALIPKDQTKTGLTLVFPELWLCAVGRFVINIIGTFFQNTTYNCLKMTGIISFVGASGVGKTSLVRALHARGDFALGLESHAERPFQALFKRDPRYALANQVDFLLFRAEQERGLRLDPRPALVDGGLDLDFHGFTRLFHARGWLTDPEFDLIRRLYMLTRDLFPPPNLIVHLTASDEAIRARLAARDRINIASAADASRLASFLDEWLDSVPQEGILRLDVTCELPDYSECIPVILARIDHL